MATRRLLVRWLGVTILLLVVTSSHSQWGGRSLYEGSDCVLSNRLPGTCRFLTQCPSQLSLVSRNSRFQPEICAFDRNDPIVCCPHGQGPRTAWTSWSQPTRPTPARTPRPTPAPTRRPTPVPTPRPTSARIQQTDPPPTGGATMPGLKSVAACRDYSKRVLNNYLVPLIFNGKPTTYGEFPHMALLGYKPPGQTNITWNCGGALISDRFVVTAAHCFTNNMLRAPVVVRLGEYDLDDDDDDGAIDYGIKSWVRHPKFTKLSWYHDLALIELNRLVQFSRFIQPACIWNQPTEPDTGLIVTGWGSTQEDGAGPMSEILLEGNGTLNKVSPQICTEFFKSATLQLRNGVQEGILCAMDPVGTVDTCPGDSGGPIQVKSNLTGVGYYVVGVVSGGSKWCGNRVPAIYTSLRTYIDWIESKVWSDN